MWELVKVADDTLNIAVRSITEIITIHGLINLDFNDVRTVLKDGGVAIMSTGYGEGEGRVKKAIEDALHSPLLNDNDVFNSKKILLNISFAEDKENEGLMMEEMNDVNDFMANFGSDYKIKWGLSVNPELGKKVKVTILATGFGIEHVDGMDVRQNQLTQSDSVLMAEEEDARQHLIKRRGDYYGESVSSPNKRRPNIFIFKQEDLDNEDIILAVESSPTANRSRKSLKNICLISNGGETDTTPTDVAVNNGSGNRIVF